MKYIYTLPFILALCGCVSAEAEIESVCADKEMTIPAAPPAVSNLVGGRTVSQSLDEDFSDTLGKVSDVADVSITSFGFNMTGNVSFIRHVKVTLLSNQFADFVVSDSDIQPTGKYLSVPFTTDYGKLQAYLTSGKVTFKVDLTGVIPDAETPVSSTVCVGVVGKVNKSL